MSLVHGIPLLRGTRRRRCRCSNRWWDIESEDWTGFYNDPMPKLATILIWLRLSNNVKDIGRKIASDCSTSYDARPKAGLNTTLPILQQSKVYCLRWFRFAWIGLSFSRVQFVDVSNTWHRKLGILSSNPIRCPRKLGNQPRNLARLPLHGHMSSTGNPNPLRSPIHNALGIDRLHENTLVVCQNRVLVAENMHNLGLNIVLSDTPVPSHLVALCREASLVV